MGAEAGSLVWDVIVVGAGPAGAAAALAARSAGLSVLLLDKADFPRDKICGDAVSPDGVAVLDELGVREAVLHDREPLGSVCLVSATGRRAAAQVQVPGYVVPRVVLDARLVQAAQEAGAHLQRAAVGAIDVDADRVIVTGKDGAVFTGRTVIGADGAYSVVRRALGLASNTAEATAVAIRGYAPQVDQALHIHWAHGRSPVYAWSFAAGAHPNFTFPVANVGYGLLVEDSRQLGGRAGMLAELRALLPQLAEFCGPVKAHQLPLNIERPGTGRGQVALVGDAASLIHPLTGEGIGYALASGLDAGRAAAEALRAGDPSSLAERYGRSLHRRLGGHLRDSLRMHRLVNTPVAGPALLDATVRAAASDPRLLDPLLALVSGEATVTPALVGRVLLGATRDRLVSRSGGNCQLAPQHGAVARR